MVIASFLAFFILSRLLLHPSAEDDKRLRPQPKCPPSFECTSHFGSFPLTSNPGRSQSLSFPFTNNSYPTCGLEINCDQEVATVKLGMGRSYNVIAINTDDNLPLLEIHDQEIEHPLSARDCDAAFKNLTFRTNLTVSFISLAKFYSRTFFKCNDSRDQDLHGTEAFFTQRGYKSYKNCQDKGYSLYYMYPEEDISAPPDVPSQCSPLPLPVKSPLYAPHTDAHNPFGVLSGIITFFPTISADCVKCQSNGGQCLNVDQGHYSCAKIRETDGRRNRMTVVVVGISVLAGLVIAMVLFCCVKGKCSSLKSAIFWRKGGESHKKIEAFLKNYGPLAPKRYGYSEVKRMTKSFKHKLGQGGYGGVYKGELPDGHLVAVKVLTESKGNGEEFTNEVASISRTSHVNIVTLIGFCFEDHKRALIYEFMPNGSLEKFIYESSSSGERQLAWETLYHIAIGIARGLEYLHRGCNTRILHFDIKPHNILLDEKFCPKISDFGLSRLCPKRESIISMLGARGTAGYIAPEIFCRNFGCVSYKSDVYSYGMMVLEMVGGRKNTHVGADRTSEIYFPQWIYKRLELDEDLGLCGIMNEEENEMARKMIIVGLWCIQTDPSNRPPMSKVMEMLEGPLGSLDVPPRPFMCSPERQPADSSNTQTV